MEKYTDENKEQFLIKLTKECYSQGDTYYAYKNKKGKWHFGYSNDYPLQHGSGKDMILADVVVNEIMVAADCHFLNRNPRATLS